MILKNGLFDRTLAMITSGIPRPMTTMVGAMCEDQFCLMTSNPTQNMNEPGQRRQQDAR